MISFEEAQKKILNKIKVLPTTEVNILNSLDCVLAEDLHSSVNIPSFDNSAMDGFAVRSSDTKKAKRKNPVRLKIVEDLPAGSFSRRKLRKGEAIRIMTGAPIPERADCVVMVENTKPDGDWVNIFVPVTKGENIRYAGEDIKKDELVLKKGILIRPQEMGVLASLGKKEVKVIRRPKVAILSTGDELVSIDQPLSPGKIRDSNRYSLYGQILKAGGKVIDSGIVKDEEKILLKKIKEASSKADLILTTGGVSVGDYDLVKKVLAKLGKVYFWKVNMKPGKPLAFGLIKGKPLFGLPGNPVSSMVVFDQFVRPSLLKMAGRKKLFRKKELAVIQEKVKKKPGRREFLRGKLSFKRGKYLAYLTGPQGSGILKSMSLADGLVILPEDKEVVKKGEKVEVEFFNYPERE
ncbi:MAG: molybdopterin molybdotransferase MoeA [candidate division Zixibacteria bacterium]|nr:molybdopterin molybdotransferase MoeA [candidate division Zixibacteria bacterium]